MSLLDNLFGPLGKEYCVWFYFLSVFSFFWVVLAIIGFITMLVMKRKNVDMYVVINSLLVIIIYFFMYLQSRLLHSMCMGTTA